VSGRILSFIKSPHQKVQELLPWFLNGTLEHDDATLVEEHLRSCAGCRSELDCLRVLQSTYAQSELAPDAEAALARLRPRLTEPAAGSRPRRPARGAPPRTAATPGWQVAIPAWMKVALATQFVLLFGLGWTVLQSGRLAPEYHGLSASGGPQHAAGNVVVVFDQGAPQREVARILRAAGGRVVDGPTESNGFVLAVADGDLKAALARLRAEPGVVLAEPLQAPPSR
jgi:hypothetical protein